MTGAARATLRATGVELANGARAALRNVASGPLRDRIAFVLAALSGLAVAVATGWCAKAVLGVARWAVPQVPGLVPEYLVERLLGGAFRGVAVLLLLGSLTTAVSTLFLSEELAHRLTLPIPHRAVFFRQLVLTLAAAAAPTLLLALPTLAVGAAAAPRPLLAAAALAASLGTLVLLAGGLGALGALLLVRLVPPRRARLLAAFVSAIGLGVALVGFRSARPERLLDPMTALAILEEIGAKPPGAPGASPTAWAALASTRALFGRPSGLALSSFLLESAAALLFVLAWAAAPLHLALVRELRESSGPARAGSGRRPHDGSFFALLVRSERATLLRDAATPAQLGSLAAVFLLYLLNLELLPSDESAARDLLAGLQTSLALFLVAALALRFAYPSVSSDGRSALLLRALPLSAARHLAARYVVRAVPALGMALVLVGATAATLRPGAGAVRAAVTLTVLGALAVPALHLGLGGLFPRYAAPNAVSVALGPGGLAALVVSTALAALAAPVVSTELRSFLGFALGRSLSEGALFYGWCAAALVSGAVPLLLAARSLGRADLPTS